MAHDVIKIALRLFNDIFSVVYFLAPMQDKKIGKMKKAAGYLVLLLLIATVWPVSMWPYMEVKTAAARFAVRGLVTFVFLTLVKEGSIKKKLHLDLLLTIIYTNFTNIFMASPFIEFRTEKLCFFSNPVINVIFVHLVQLAVLFVMLWFVRRECEFNKERKYSTFLIGFYLFISLVSIYMKQSMKIRYDYQNQFHMLSEISAYYYALLILLLAVLVFMERFFKTEGLRRDLEVMVSLQNYRYQALMEREKLEKKLHCLQHDMKNHLLAIKSMADDNKQVKHYIEQLQEKMEETRTVVETGNTVINGLMAEKLQWAVEQGIDVNVNMDLRQSGFIREVDLCAMITNAMDNAIEASVRVEDKKKRRIHVKAGAVQGYLVFRVMNYFEHDLVMDGDRLMSSKKDDKLHGLGILSIRYTLEKYHGSYSAEVDENHYFVLKIAIPIPGEGGAAGN